jgi:CBS domain-containing protein
MGPLVVCVDAALAPVRLEQEFARARSALLPVVVPTGRFVGVLWRADLAALSSFDAPEGAVLRVDRRALALPESAPVRDALPAMTVDRVRAIPVLGDDGSVTGVLSDVDLLRWYGRVRKQAG